MKQILTYLLIAFVFLSCVKEQKQSLHYAEKSVDGIHLSDLQMQLGHIATDSVREQELGDEFILAGILSVNQNRTTALSSRVMGRIEKSYFKNVGDVVKAGEPIYDIYSEELNLAAKEFLLAGEKKSLNNPGNDMQKLYQIAKNKLLRYGLADSQIKEIGQKGVFSNVFSILSTATGIILSIEVKEGAYVMEGESVFHLADLSSLWVEAQVYRDDLKMIAENAIAKIYLSGYETELYEGTVSFVNPALNPSSGITVVRIEILNKDRKLKPGMQATVLIISNRRKNLAVPTDAVILEAKSATVWMKTGHNRFKGIMVHTGAESNGFTEITRGLNKGDVIVSSGAYLLNSEFIIRQGSDRAQVHQH
ncbi:MAG TPA: efflux RND transporter periplasmic adaptor subunit [Chitinophagaceae bacterium]|nr:efflux RND transporter periplasmic adaptor subunit [Chitinophagaceae bacterium]